MIKDVYNFPILNGREGDRKVLGDLIDATDPDSISQVFVEDKLYETWYHGRTVLIGDAVHKMAPNAGQGGVNAMEDAVILANCLYEISDGKQAVTPGRIAEAFKDYREQRYIHAKYQVENSANMTKILSGQVKNSGRFVFKKNAYHHAFPNVYTPAGKHISCITDSSLLLNTILLCRIENERQNAKGYHLQCSQVVNEP
jgi:2-polyprenyl-6-methoxyphenol hydroxylase-like FAD-dependent oxidoreductase